MAPVFERDPAQPGYLYAQFADYLAALITSGKLQPGARLSGERDLAAEHGVSIGTVRRATALLRDRGLIVTLPAKGTYIATTGPPAADLGSGEKPVPDILAAARPLSSIDEMIIDDLTQDEEDAFHDAIRDSSWGKTICRMEQE